MNITLLYGTETGNAELLCEDIAAELSAAHEVDIANLEDTDPTALDLSRFHIVVCSTYGEGDLPASALPFAETLAASGHDLSGLRFAVFGLGDMTYAETFANGSNRMAALLTAHGAQMFGARGTHDASSGDAPEDVALPWVRTLIDGLA